MFINNAIYAYYTNITSCFRKKLIDCVNNLSIENENGIYGQIDPLLFQSEMNIFINDTMSNTTIFTAIQSNIALDNINIVISNLSVSNNICVQAYNGFIMIVDSYIMDGYDISYNNQSCKLLNNTRLVTNTQYLSLLSISCISTGIDNLQKSMNSNVTQFSHF